MAAQKQILESIRDIIGNKGGDEEILDLTEVVEPAVNAKPIDLFQEELEETKEDKVVPFTNDVLSEIDALLAFDEKKEEQKNNPEQAIELDDFIKPELVETARTEEPQPAEPQIAAPQEITQGDTKMENEEALISDRSAEEARDSLKKLMAAAENVSKPKVQTAPFRNGDTVEDLVMDMLKPILKEWMDTNLPGLVQSIVEKEIKKLIPKEY